MPSKGREIILSLGATFRVVCFTLGITLSPPSFSFYYESFIFKNKSFLWKILTMGVELVNVHTAVSRIHNEHFTLLVLSPILPSVHPSIQSSDHDNFGMHFKINCQVLIPFTPISACRSLTGVQYLFTRLFFFFFFLETALLESSVCFNMDWGFSKPTEWTGLLSILYSS